MTPSASPAPSSLISDNETERSFSDTERFVARAGRAGSAESEVHNGWELDWIEDHKLDEASTRHYKLKFKGYPMAEWQPEDNVDALELVRCYWEHRDQGLAACIQAQQSLLKEIAERPDSEDSDNDGQPALLRDRVKCHRQLKPRPRAGSREDADADLAHSDSSSSGEEDNDDDRAPMSFQLIAPTPLSLLPGYQLPSRASTTYTYHAKNPEINQLLKLIALEKDLENTAGNEKNKNLAAYHRRRLDIRKIWQVSPFVKKMEDHLTPHSYIYRKPERVEKVQNLLMKIKQREVNQPATPSGRKGKIKLLFTPCTEIRENVASDERVSFCGSRLSDPISTTPITSPTAQTEPPLKIMPAGDSRFSDVRPGLHCQPRTTGTRSSPPRFTPTTASLAPHLRPIHSTQNARPGGTAQRAEKPLVQNRPPERALDPEEQERIFLQAHPGLKRKFIAPSPHRHVKKNCLRRKQFI